MILDVVPVIPPELRPLVPLDGGRFATSDLNDLYRRVINRNNRLKRLIELRAPDIIVRNEKRMLQESVDALFDNGRRGRAITGANKRPLKSLSDMLKGKQGRFRQNLLGKRVDYSGRSVIVVGPELKLHQCGLPKKMALELFKPFIYSKLEKYGHATTIKAAKRMVEKERPEVWDILEEVIREHPVMLNRAPTLAPLGHPGVRAGADRGQGDPASPAGLHRVQCRLRRRPDGGARAAVAGSAARRPRADDVHQQHPQPGERQADHRAVARTSCSGMYYLSLETPEFRERPRRQGAGLRHHRRDRACAVCQGDHAARPRSSARCETIDAGGNAIRPGAWSTTPGRMMIAQILPKHPDVPFDLINRQLTKKNVSDVIDAVYRHCGQKECVIFADRLMGLGFGQAAKAGISFGKDDLIIPAEKPEMIRKTQGEVKEFEQQYQDGLITAGERYNKVVDAWSRCTDEVAGAMMKEISKQQSGTATDSVWMMSHSGARGSPAQMRQLGRHALLNA